MMRNWLSFLHLLARDRFIGRRERSLTTATPLLEPLSTLLLLVVLVNATMTGVQLGDAAFNYTSKSDLADAVAAMPQDWADSVRERRLSGAISGYRAELELQLVQDLRAQADPLAERIRAMRDDEWDTFLGSQAFQQALGIVGGRCVGGVVCGAAGSQAGKVAGEVGQNLVDFGWNAQAAALGAATADLAVDLEAKRALVRKEMERLLGRQLDDWKTAEPLLEARLHHRVRYIERHLDQWTDDELVERARALAYGIDQVSRITRAGGSEDSPFADYKELAEWLVAKARPEAVTEEASVQVEFDLTDWFPKDAREQFCRTVVEPVLPAGSNLLAYVTQFVQGCLYTSPDAEGNWHPSTVGITVYGSDAVARQMFDESCREGTGYAEHQAGLEGHRLEFTDNRMIDIRTHSEGLVSIRVDELYGNAHIVLEHRDLQSYSLATVDALAEAVRAEIDTRRAATIIER